MKSLTIMMTLFLLMLAGGAIAQEDEGRKLTRKEKKALQPSVPNLPKFHAKRQKV